MPPLLTHINQWRVFKEGNESEYEGGGGLLSSGTWRTNTTMAEEPVKAQCASVCDVRCAPAEMCHL